MRRLLYILAIVAAAGAVAYFVARERRFALPGPLHQAHASLARDCFACHAQDRTLDNHKCSGCHADPQTGQSIAFKGFGRHHAYGDLACIECHIEHRGAAGDLTRPGHALAETECAVCHERHVGRKFAYRLPRTAHPSATLHKGHAKWQDDCFACHTEGGGVSPQKCSECHEPGAGGGLAFVGFACHHTYEELDCLACHIEHAGPDAPRLRPGKSFQTTGCNACHQRHVGPDHTYSLASDLHPKGTIHPLHARWAGECFLCHRRGTGQAQCTSCHDPVSKRPVAFTGFKAHHLDAELDCLQCHTDHRGGAAHATVRPGKEWPHVACKTCHERHVGPDHMYGTPASRHPAATLHPSHLPWSGDCYACHKRGSADMECTTCHEPETGKRVELKGFKAHHFDPELKCLQCHTDHHGSQPGGCTKPGIAFATTDCLLCHARKLKEPTPLGKLPAALRGEATTFEHMEHPRDKVACAECHPMAPEKAHTLTGAYSRNCTECHHGPKQQASCATCHRAQADYFAGKFEGRLIPRGTHCKSGDVRCQDCHKFDPAAARLRPSETTCTGCHPADYTPLFLAARSDWQAWGKGLERLDPKDPETQRLRFIARNWYHNDAHATATRKAAQQRKIP